MDGIKRSTIWKLHTGFWILFFLMSITLTSRMMVDVKAAFGASFTNIITLIPIIYTILYFLTPRFWDKKKYTKFWIYTILLLITAAFLRTGLAHGIVYLLDGDEEKLGKDGFFFQFLVGSFFTTLLILPLKWVEVLFDKIKFENQLKTQKLESELLFLRAQVNPHFLFNALNNIYSLSYTKSDKAPEFILKLSDMMSYMLYDTSNEKVLLENELMYLRNYIDLQRIKKSKPLNVHFIETGDIHLCRLEPMLLIALVENAFKHGDIHESEDGWINIHVKVGESTLFFDIANSYKNPLATTDKSGVGLANIKSRLDILYPNKHKLSIRKQDGKFEVQLEIQF